MDFDPFDDWYALALATKNGTKYNPKEWSYATLSQDIQDVPVTPIIKKGIVHCPASEVCSLACLQWKCK